MISHRCADVSGLLVKVRQCCQQQVKLGITEPALYNYHQHSVSAALKPIFNNLIFEMQFHHLA